MRVLLGLGAWRRDWVVAASVAATLLTGCKDDDPGNADGEGSTTEATTGAESTSSEASGSSSDGSSTGGSAEGDGSSSTTGPSEINLGGTIQDFFVMEPIAGAQLSVLEVPELQTTADEEGVWSLEGLPPETLIRVMVEQTDTYWGAVIPTYTGSEDDDDVELSQVSIEVVDIQEGALQDQDPTVMVDETKAALLVAVEQNTATGAVVQLDPPPPANTYYAPNANGQPILNQNEIQWGLYPVAVFFNLEPGDAGTYEITVTHPERECTVDDPTPPTFGRHINLIRVDCPPPR